MPFWKRSKSELELARKAFATPGLAGSAACSEHLCDRHDAVTCSYMDPRGHRCTLTACPDHQGVVDGRPYCHLHADTLRAVGMVAGDTHLPEVDNPGPSLVSWVARDLHDRMVACLEEMVATSETERVVADEVVTPVRAADGSRRWEQAWKILDHTGIRQKVTVLVQETAPTEMIVWVNGQVVSQATPPWFGGFQHGEHISSAEAVAERRAFYEPIHTRIAQAVIAERAAGVRGPY